MKKLCNITLGVLIFLTVVIIGVCLFYNYQLTPVMKEDTIVEIEIPNNTTSRKIATILKENKLIRDEKIFLIYIKLMNVNNMKAGYYDIPANAGIKKIVSLLQKGSKKNPNEISITFKEGINIRTFATIVSKNTNNSYDSILELLKDESYLQTLIDTYWFIGNEIKNNKLYYSLEGYLFPDTYLFSGKEVTTQEIITKMLNQMGKVLSEYRDEIEKSSMSVHQILTLASLIEKEGKKSDFKDISSVFHNRLSISMALQSCASAYYGLGLEFNELGIATAEVISPKNDYNTYQLNGLPVGPISLPGKDTIEAALFPNNTEYLYFLSDNQQKTYFFKTYQEHQAMENKLKAEGKWYR